MTFQPLLPITAGIFEKAIEEVYGTALDQLEPEVIKTFWDPDACPAGALSVLAHALSVDLWDDDWDELKKRSVIKRWVTLEFSKGTYAGYRDFIEISGGRLVDFISPPQAIYASRDLTKDEWQTWLDQMPRIRVVFGVRPGVWDPPVRTFAGHTYAGYDFTVIDDAEAYYGRQAFLRKNKTADDEPMLVGKIVESFEDRPAVDYERVVIPGYASLAEFAGHGFAGHTFAGGDVPPQVYTYALDRTYVYGESTLQLNAISPGYRPLNVNYERVGEIGEAGDRTFAGHGFAGGETFAMADDAPFMLADVMYLNNPDTAAPMMAGFSFAGVSRTSMPAYTAEFMIEAPRILPWGCAVADVSFAGHDFAVPEDLRHIDKIMRAIVAAKAKRDKITVTFETTRTLTIGDAPRLGDGFHLGSRVPATL